MDTCEVPAPTIYAERDSTCSGQPVLLWATGCDGKVEWTNGLTGDTIVSRPATTRIYTAFCVKGDCRSTGSNEINVIVPFPDIPVLNASSRTVCAGGSAVLTASGCPGEVVWSNGSRGREITVRPAQTTSYTAICRMGNQSVSTLNCISCFASPLEIKVADSIHPVLISSRRSICANDTFSLRVAACPGTVRWADASDLTASSRLVKPAATTTYQAFCKVGDCDFATNLVSVRVGPAPIPVITAGRTEVCAGEKIKVSASGCDGPVTWSDGQTGSEIMFSPETTSEIKARCGQGDCQSEFSAPMTFTVNPLPPTPLVRNRQNECPYITLDLMLTLQQTPRTEGGRYEFRTAASAGSPEVVHPGIARAGTYYVFEKSAAGCHSDAAAVTITIKECMAPVPVCAYFPGSVSVKADSTAGLLRLTAELGGSASRGAWATSGSGAFGAADSTYTTYIPSVSDYARGSVTLTFLTDDPDGEGPCEGVADSMSLPVHSAGTGVATTPIPPRDSTSVNNQNLPGGLFPVTSNPAEIFIPEGFSPNGDGINDRFVLGNVPDEINVSLEVYNRWGQLVHQENDYKGDWDGKGNRNVAGGGKKELADGTYFYMIRLSDGREFVKFLTITH
ncbi:hypothetical protein GCM10007390_02360 [Persicitalea jodogahamensis]|uniref:Gliding motility-associated C-terminal domain-containing protein n=1 Tax=Persicitalea jodogahamensis TaxID=402147 RepID=A0A8J3G747_9BACT|nr:hypothetical protein GCM10007390_02360 [Persicitalea jodogahamensis]